MAEHAEEQEEVTEDILSLSDTFNDEEDVEAGTTAEAETVETDDSEKGETDEVKAESDAETPSAEVDSQESGKSETVPMAALIAERHKRQAAEQKLKETQPEVIPDPIDDPEGYAKHIESKADKGLLDTRITLSRDLMMDSKDDYLEKEKVFMGLIADEEGAITDKSLHEKFLAAKNPAKFAYDYAKEQIEIAELRDPKYKENLKEQLRAEILAELKAEKPKLAAVKATDVPNLTTASEAGSNSTEVEKELELGDLFG